MSAYTPTVVVQFAFGYAPFATPSWTTANNSGLTVESINIERGRSSEFDDFPAGKCQVVFKDSNRILDPSNAAGPYFGDLLPRVPMRVVATVGVTDYVRFYGFVDGWPLQNGRGLTTVTVTATDAQKILASKRLPLSVYETVVLADSPFVFWPLGETGTVAADLTANRLDGNYTPNTARGQTSVVPHSAGSSIGLSALNYQGVRGGVGARITLPCSVEMWVQADAPDSTTQRYLFWQYGGTVGTGIFLLVGNDSDTDRFLIAYVRDSGGADYIVSWQFDIYDGQPHHLVFTLTSSTATCYVDGVSAPVRATASGVTANPASQGPMIGSYPFASFVSIDGLIDDVSLWDVELAVADVVAHYEAGAFPWDGDTTGGRIDRVLDLIGWPAGNRAIDTGEMVLGPADIAGSTALEYLKTVAASEQGRLFVDASGNITFHQRDRFLTEATETTSQFVFSDDGAGDGIYAGLNFTLDETKIVNGADVSRVGGVPQHVEDTSSQADYGPNEKSVSGLLLTSDAAARQIADYLVYRYATPQVRAEGWSMQPEMDATSWADVLMLELGHRVTLECKPINVGSQIVLDQHIERVSDDITPSTWTIEFNGSPTDDADYLIWGTGVWGTEVWR